MAPYADDQDDEPKGLDMSADEKKAHDKAVSAFHVSASFFSKQREREMSDLKFIDFDEQWDPAVKTQRAGNQAVGGAPPTPARPAITINQLRGPCQQVAAQRRNAKLALSFAPKGAGANQDIAEAFEDIARAIQVESRASIARNWAGDRAEKAGMGWYRIDTEYASESPTDSASWNDQEIVYRRILNQASVYPDPFAQEPDFSDGRRLFITQDLPWERYKAEYPDSKLASVSEGELTGIGNTKPDFVFDGDVDGEQGKTVRIAECWEAVETVRTWLMLEDGRTLFEDELTEGQQVAIKHRRKMTDRKILWSKINALEYLEKPTEWNGKYIPVIPVLWEESNVNGERRWTGIVRPGREAAVAYNVMRSAQIETISTATKSPYIGYMETIEPYLDWWKNANSRNFPMLPVKAARGPDGNVLPPPQRNTAEPAIQAITMAAQAAKEDIHTTTGVPPVALGNLDPHERSGKAIQALQQQAETGASGGLDNLVNISMAYEGKILRDLIPRIFDRPGRIVPAVGVDEKRRMVMLGVPFTFGPQGEPIAVPGWKPGMPIPDGAEYIDLTGGQFSVQPIVGKSYSTRREEAGAAIGNVLQVVPPEMAAAIAPAWLEEQDYPGAKKIAEIAKKALPPQLAQAYQEDDGQPNIPPEIQAQLQQLQQALQEAQQIIQTDQAKVQGQMQVAGVKAQVDSQKAQMDAQVELARNQADNATKLEIAKLNAQTELVKAQIAAQAADQDRRIAILEAMIGAEKEARLTMAEHAHHHELSAQEHEQDRQLQREAPRPSPKGANS